MGWTYYLGEWAKPSYIINIWQQRMHFKRDSGRSKRRCSGVINETLENSGKRQGEAVKIIMYKKDWTWLVQVGYTEVTVINVDIVVY